MPDHRALVYSRPLATAERLGEHAPDRHRFLEKRVVLTGDANVLATPNGRVMALTALRLLPRLTPNVFVWIPDAPPMLVDELRREAARVSFDGHIPVIADADPTASRSLEAADAVLSIGPYPAVGSDAGASDGGGNVSDRWTTIASNGWCSWVSRGALLAPVVTTQTNPVGAIAAASLGVAEVFKVFMVLRPERGVPADGTPFSLFTYRVGDADSGPALSNRLEVDALVVGMGAIGNGIVATLAELPLAGRIVVLDRQRFGSENLGTCVLVGPKDINMEKPAIARRHLEHLEPGLSVEPRFGDAEQMLTDVHPVPAVVLNGLDNPNARREAQRLWADITVDGAIGDFMCQVSRHPGDPDIDTACLRCLFPPAAGPRAELAVAAATGLLPNRVLDEDDFVREQDVLAAPEHRREALRAVLGQQIKVVTCSVAPEELARAISSVEQRRGFEPSVPFVATCSAAMVVGEWLKATMGLPSPLAPRFQFDVLQGPAAGIEFPEARHADCQCVERREIIARVRASRRATGEQLQQSDPKRARLICGPSSSELRGTGSQT